MAGMRTKSSLAQELAFLEPVHGDHADPIPGAAGDRGPARRYARDGLWSPSLILQPLVENAVKHGVDKMSDRGKLRIQESNGSGQTGADSLRLRCPGPGLNVQKPGTEKARGVGLGQHSPGGSSNYTVAPKAEPLQVTRRRNDRRDSDAVSDSHRAAHDSAGGAEANQ